MKDTYRARVDSQAVVLVLHSCATDGDTVALTDVESIGVVATVVITIGVINVDVAENDVVGLDAESLDGGVLDVQAGDGRIIQIVGIKEFGLGFSTVRTLTIPPSLSTAINGVVGSSRDGNVRPRDTDKWAIPLLVSKGGLTAEDDLDR